MEELVNDIGAEEDPTEKFRAMERYHKFTQAQQGLRVRDDLPQLGFGCHGMTPHASA